MTKLTAAQKKEVKALWDSSTSAELQTKYGVSKSTIRRAVRGGDDDDDAVATTVTEESKAGEDDAFSFQQPQEDTIEQLELIHEDHEGRPLDPASAARDGAAFDRLLPETGASAAETAEAVAAAADAAAEAEAAAQAPAQPGGPPDPGMLDQAIRSLGLDQLDIEGAAAKPKRQAPPPPPPPPPRQQQQQRPATQQAEAKQVPDAFIRLAVRQYAEHFPMAVEAIAGERSTDRATLLRSITKMRRSELDELYSALKSAVYFANTTTMIKELANTGVSVVEAVGCQTGALEVQGLGEALRGQADWDSVLLEISIEQSYAAMKFNTPGMRAATLFAGSVFRLHHANRAARLQAEYSSARTAPLAAPREEAAEEEAAAEQQQQPVFEVGEAVVEEWNGL